MKTRDELIIDNMNLVYKVYNDNFKNTSFYIDKEDLIAEGNLALVKCANKYNYTKKFSTYAYICIKNAMINYCNKEFKHKEVLSLDAKESAY